MVFTIYSLLFLVSALIAIVAGFLAWQRHNSRGAKSLAFLMFSSIYWSLTVFMEAAVTSMETKLLWSKISYLAVVLTPVLYLNFVYNFVGNKRLGTIKKIAPLTIVPLIVLLLCWTNDYHHLIWSSFSPINPETNLAVYYHGLGFFIGYLGYNYLLLGWATILLGRFILKHQKTFRSQGWIVLIASLCPWIASSLYLLNINIADGFDLTPGSISLSGILFIFAILEVRLLDLVPIAREALVENLPEGILVLDNRNRIQDINASAKIQLGMDNDHVLGEEINHTNIQVPGLLDVLLSTETSSYFEVPDSEMLKVYRVNKVMLKTKPESRLIVVRDISDTIAKQNEIQRSEAEYKSLYNMFRLMADNMPDMIWAKDLDLNYIFVNKAICEGLLMADSMEEPIGKSWEYFVNREQHKKPDDPEWHSIGRYSKNTDSLILETRQSGVFEEYGNLNGKFVYLDIRKAPIIDEQGNMVGIVGSSRDVTRQKQTESELITAKERAEESDRLKSAFLANMSHEIRTPMNSILGFISLLQEPDIPTDIQHEYYKSVRSGAERLLSTINDIIELSRIDSGETQVMNSDNDVLEIFAVLYSMYYKKAKDKGLQFINNYKEATNLLIHCDRNKLFGIISNLLKNAIKYTNTGSIELGCMSNSDRIRFYVKDTGIGIPKGRQKDIFERFVQVDGSNSRLYEGSGLGLSLSKAYVEMMGGSIWVDSEENEGCTVYFELPVSAQKDYSFENVETEKPVEIGTATGLRILIVEDDPSSYDYLNLILQRANHRVVHTFTGFEAVELCRQRSRFDIILMDVKLPGIDGYETTRRIRDLGIEIPILAVSAFAFTEDQQRAIKAGCNDYITKPINQDHLLSKLNQYAPHKS
jgi:PAS domain S-box-containing protein